MQIIEEKEIWKSFCNICENCNQCEYKIYVFLPLTVKMGHWFYVHKNYFKNLEQKCEGF